MILREIHRVASDEKNFENVVSGIEVHTVLLKDKERSTGNYWLVWALALLYIVSLNFL